MAVAFLQEFAPTGDRSTTNYDAISARLAAEGDTPPDGLIVHSAGFGEDGTFRIYDVWETREHQQRFYNDRLMPIVGEIIASASDAPPPDREEVYELHDVIAGSPSGVA
jgi:hypothetical protein